MSNPAADRTEAHDWLLEHLGEVRPELLESLAARFEAVRDEGRMAVTHPDDLVHRMARKAREFEARARRRTGV